MVTHLSMNQEPNFEPDKTQGFGGGEERGEEPGLLGQPSLAMTREQLIIAGWSGFLGVAYAGGKEDQKAYKDLKRGLFRSIAGDDIR